MDFQDEASAIDDSYEPVHIHPTPDGPRVIEGKSGYNGPRSGHWTVSDSLIGSGIDGGCNTIHQVASPRDGNPAAHVQPISKSTLRKLAKVASAQRKAGAVVGASVPGGNNGHELLETLRDTPASAAQPTVPKGFYVPKHDQRGLRIRAKNGQHDVVRQPQVLPLATRKDGVVKKDVEAPTKETERPPLPGQSATSAKAPSARLSASQPKTRAARIVGKNGEQIFVELPYLVPGSQPSTVTKGEKSKEAHSKELDNELGAQAQSTENSKAEKARRDSNAAKAAFKLREEREHQTRVSQQQADDAKIAAEALMSGAVPSSSRGPSTPRQASVLSIQSSGNASARMDEGSSRSKLASAASSKTSLASSHEAAIAKTTLEGSPRVPSELPNSRPEVLSKHSHASPVPGWQEFGRGQTQQAAQSSSTQRLTSVCSRRPYVNSNPPAVSPWNARRRSSVHSRQSSGTVNQPIEPTPEHSFNGALGFEEIEPVQAHSCTTSAPWSWKASAASFERPPTVFAGRGWISPHPLSRAGTEFDEPPEPAIRLTSRNMMQEDVTMTFEEWKEIQQSAETESMHRESERRNISTTTSSRRSHVGAMWGNNATVESAHSADQFDGVLESGYKVQLRMPWDGPGTTVMEGK